MSSDGFEATATVIGKSDAYIKVEPLAISVVCAYFHDFGKVGGEKMCIFSVILTFF